MFSVQCGSIHWLSFESVTCTTQLDLGDAPLSFASVAAFSTDDMLMLHVPEPRRVLSWDQPEPTQLLPPNMPTGGGTVLTVLGSDFGEVGA